MTSAAPKRTPVQSGGSHQPSPPAGDNRRGNRQQITEQMQIAATKGLIDGNRTTPQGPLGFDISGAPFTDMVSL